MCITVSKDVEERYKECRSGWKVFSKNGRPYFVVQSGKIPRECWINEKEYRPPLTSCFHSRGDVIYSSNGDYTKGWHIYLERDGIESIIADSMDYCDILQVDFDNPVAYGTFDGVPTVVATDMYVHSGLE